MVRIAHGAGLGLAIARQIAEQHGGTIDVTCVAVEGSVFILNLPVAGNLPDIVPA